MFSASARARPRVVASLRAPVTSLSPFAPATIEGYRLGGLIFEPLARVDPRTNDLIPWLALSWTRLPAGRGVRVELRPGVKFSDGHALTAEDVRDTLKTFRAPERKAATWTPLWADVIDALVISPRVIEFRTRRLTFETLRNIMTTLRILPRHRAAEDLVGSGPFQKSTLSGTRVEFTPNPTWWHAPRPDFDLNFRMVADVGLARDLIARGELDVFAPAGTDDASAVAAGPGEGLWIDLNLRRPPFADARVRRALLMLWDRGELNQKLFGGRRTIAVDTFDPNAKIFPPAEPVAFDPARARTLLAEAGWREDHGHLARAGRRLEFELLVSGADQERWAALLQGALNSSGVTMTIKRATMDGEWWRRLREGDFDAAAGSGAPSVTVNADAWASTAAYNVNGLKDAELDRTLDRLNLEFDPARRAKLERAAILRVRASLAQVPGLIAPRGAYLVGPRVKIDQTAPEEPWRWRLTGLPPP